jgi:hypothetical protein
MHDMIRSSFPSWLEDRVLPDSISLQILDRQGTVLFSSSGKWLHPLLDVQRFVEEERLPADELILHDRIAGRAAAALAVHIGFKIVKLSLMSTLAEKVYRSYGIEYLADGVVDRIACQTEDLIDDSMNPEDIFAFILDRAEKASR